MKLGIYEYSVDEQWDTNHAAAVIAGSRADADQMYLASLSHDCDRDAIEAGRTVLKVKTRPIKEGMVIAPHGYDYCALSFT